MARWEDVIGKQGEDVENDSGRLLSFSAENGFKVLNTFYEHKEIHKYTWKCLRRGLKSRSRNRQSSPPCAHER